MIFSTMNKAREIFEQAMCSLRGGKFVEAITVLRLVISIDPQHADAHAALCVAAHEEGEHDLIYTSTMKLFDLPERAAIHRAVAVSYYDSGCYKEAVNTICESIQLCPDEALNYYILGRSQLALFELKEARESLLKACNLAPDFAVVKSLLTWLDKYLSIEEGERLPLLVNMPCVPMHRPPPDICEMKKYPFTQDSLNDLYGNVSVFYGAGDEI